MCESVVSDTRHDHTLRALAGERRCGVSTSHVYFAYGNSAAEHAPCWVLARFMEQRRHIVVAAAVTAGTVAAACHLLLTRHYHIQVSVVEFCLSERPQSLHPWSGTAEALLFCSQSYRSHQYMASSAEPAASFGLSAATPAASSMQRLLNHQVRAINRAVTAASNAGLSDGHAEQ